MPAPLDAGQRRLIAFLSVATFFEGYDFFALAQILPELRAEMGLNRADAGWLLALVNAGTMLGGFLVRQADRVGRRKVLTWTIIGYTICSFLTALAPNIWMFAAAQVAARVFLIGEWAIAMVYAAEEFPADRRGFVIGVVQAFSSLGAIVCAGVVPLLLHTAWGWRSVYAVGTIPLLIVAFARRNLQETRRFAASGPPPASAPWALLAGPLRGRVLLVAAIWALTYVCTQNAITFWKEFAMAERSFSAEDVGHTLTLGALGSLPLLFLTGRLLDRLGRRVGGVLIFLTCIVGTVCAYTLNTRIGLGFAVVAGIYGTNAVLPVLNAYTAELFPTERRADAFALANSMLGRVGYVLSPIAVGMAAESWGWGPSVAATAVGPTLALLLLWALLPETRGRELEETSR